MEPILSSLKVCAMCVCVCVCVCVYEVAQSRPTLSDPMDCSLPRPSVHGIFQARVLEWGAIAFSDTLGRLVKTVEKDLSRQHQP